MPFLPSSWGHAVIMNLKAMHALCWPTDRFGSFHRISVGSNREWSHWKVGGRRPILAPLHRNLKASKAKQRCVMGVGMCLYAQLVQTNNRPTWCKSAIIMHYHPYLSGFCSRPRLTQPYNHIISWCCQNLSSLLLKVSVVAADITISGKLFQTLTILGAKENFLKS